MSTTVDGATSATGWSALFRGSSRPTEVFISYFAQQLQGLGPLAAGYLGTALAAGWTGASLLVGGMSDRRDQLLRTAPLVSAVGLAGLVFVGPMVSGGAPVIAAITLGFVLLGAGVGAAWPHLVTAVMSSTPEREQRLAGAAVTTVQLTAASAGAAIGGVVVNLAGFAEGGTGVDDAARWLYVACLVAPALAGVAIWRATRRGVPTAIVEHAGQAAPISD